MAISFGQYSKNKFMEYESQENRLLGVIAQAKDKQTFENTKNELLKVRKMHWEKLKNYYQGVVSDPVGRSTLEIQEAKDWLRKVSLDQFTRFDRQLQYTGV